MSYTCERPFALRLRAGAPVEAGVHSPAAASTWRRGDRR